MSIFKRRLFKRRLSKRNLIQNLKILGFKKTNTWNSPHTWRLYLEDLRYYDIIYLEDKTVSCRYKEVSIFGDGDEKYFVTNSIDVILNDLSKYISINEIRKCKIDILQKNL